jgi:uncharacterized membrane protein
MHLERYKLLFIAVSLIGILLFAAPSFGLLFKSTNTEKFSILYILGPNNVMRDIPFNIKAGVEYKINLGVENHVGSSAYYVCDIKFGNRDDALPNTTLGISSPLPIIYEYKQFILDGKYWEAPLTFKIDAAHFYESKSTISSITINGIEYEINKESLWDSNRKGFYYNLIVELWLFNSTDLQFCNRYVNLMLNVTQ